MKGLQSFLEEKVQYINFRVMYVCILKIPLGIQRDMEDFIPYNLRYQTISRSLLKLSKYI